MKYMVGWQCILLHDYPEEEGIVWFERKPKIEQTFLLPSSEYKEVWKVHSVNEDQLSFTAIKVGGDGV